MNLQNISTVINAYVKSRKKYKRKHVSIYPLIDERSLGLFHMFYNDLRYDCLDSKQTFYNYTRMRIDTFDALLSILKESITDVDDWRHITPEEKILVTLRYMATGLPFNKLHPFYRLGFPALTKIVKKVCAAIWMKRQSICRIEPSTLQWVEIANDFLGTTDFPNCLGAIDGRHIKIETPNYKSTNYSGYKNYYSIVLLAACDADYKFTNINVIPCLKYNSETIVQFSKFHKDLMNKKLKIPPKYSFARLTSKPMPYAFVADSTFRLCENILRPYNGEFLNIKQKIFNHKIAKPLQYIDRAFNVLTNKWRIFQYPLKIDLDFGIDLVRACCVVHNFIGEREGYFYEREAPELEKILSQHYITNLTRDCSWSAMTNRDYFADYFINEGKHEFIDDFDQSEELY